MPMEVPSSSAVDQPRAQLPSRQVCAQTRAATVTGMARDGSLQTERFGSVHATDSGGFLAPGADTPWDSTSLLCSHLGAEASLPGTFLYSLHTACSCYSSASSHPAHTDGPRGREHKTLPCYRRFPNLMSMPTDSKY